MLLAAFVKFYLLLTFLLSIWHWELLFWPWLT